MCTEHAQGSMDVYRACTGQHGCVQSMHILRSMNTPIACFLLTVAFDSSSLNSITACDVDIALLKPY